MCATGNAVRRLDLTIYHRGPWPPVIGRLTWTRPRSSAAISRARSPAMAGPRTAASCTPIIRRVSPICAAVGCSRSIVHAARFTVRVQQRLQQALTSSERYAAGKVRLTRYTKTAYLAFTSLTRFFNAGESPLSSWAPAGAPFACSR